MRISRMKRFVLRILFNLLRMLLLPVEIVSVRHFMKLYTRLLTALGVRFDGEPRYISRRVRFDDFELIRIGARAVVSERVVFLTHDYSLTTGLVCLDRTPDSDVAFIRGISIGRNVFIGLGSIILPGTNLGDNTVVGAGSVVRGRFEENSVIAGNPAVRLGCLTDYAERWASRSLSAQLRID